MNTYRYRRFSICHPNICDQKVDEQAFRDRTRQLGIRVIRMAAALPQQRAADVIARQIIRCATSVGANYRAACRARSTADMIAKLGIVLEEADETLYWLEVIVETDLLPAARLADLMQETNAIIAMTVASIKTLRTPDRKPKT
ncbi:four helix bundle protein [Roseiflexus sp.]|uniref:four helix bundle protein n=1 Tax=Roseiflexus sp. TaxID=2562120 RepID=UPI00398A88AD